jgi:hypothetical protein
MNRFRVVLDACVLYPAPLRDLLLELAISGLYKAHWSPDIHEESRVRQFEAKSGPFRGAALRQTGVSGRFLESACGGTL